MSIVLSEAEISEIQEKYDYLVNYETDDTDAPIDPLTYIDSNGDNLLHIAAQGDDRRTIELLLKAGLNVNQTGDMGCTALHYTKNQDIIDLLISHGASKSIRNDFGKLPGEV